MNAREAWEAERDAEAQRMWEMREAAILAREEREARITAELRQAWREDARPDLRGNGMRAWEEEIEVRRWEASKQFRYEEAAAEHSRLTAKR